MIYVIFRLLKPQKLQFTHALSVFSKAIEIIVYTPSLYFVFVNTIEILVYTGHFNTNFKMRRRNGRYL